MTRVLLTGATGFIGTHVARALLSRDYEIRALVRDPEGLAAGLDSISTVVGDVRNSACVDAAVADCDAIIHTAAVYSFSSRRAEEIFSTNVVGTANVLRAAAQSGIQRIVYTSTVGTIDFTADGQADFNAGRLATEEDRASPASMTGLYKRSKYESERLARRMAASGEPIIIVKPTFPVGPMDRKPTPTGQTIVDFMHGRLPAVVDTGLNVVDVTDVAEGHVLALEHGQPGRDYILGNKDGNLTLLELLQRLATITGQRAPKWKIPHAVASAAAAVDTLIEGALLGREPRIPMDGVRMARSPMWVDPSRAIDEVGLPQRSIDDALRTAVDWYTDNGYIPPAHQRNSSLEGKP